MAIIYLFGDSITYGAWDIDGGGWANLMRKDLDQKQEEDDSLYYLTYNLGIPGDTTDGLIARFGSEFKAREREDWGEENIFAFALGSNDSVYLKDKSVFRVPEERFESNIQSVLDVAQKKSQKIILINITPVDEAICATRYGVKGKERFNSNIETYNKRIARLAESNSLPLVDVYSAYNAQDYRKLLSEDGLHPNSTGHQLIFKMVMEAFERGKFF